MPDLILLCAGAAVDLSPPDAPMALDGRAAADAIAGGAFARAFERGALLGTRDDDTALPRELPEEAWLRARFGVPDGDAIEAWCAARFGQPVPAWHATPVNVQVGHYQLLLADPLGLALSQAHAQALADAVTPLFAQAGFALRVAGPMHWFLAGHPEWMLQARSWTMAVGRSIDGYLPAGEQARAWRRLFTEAQIAWHEHPVNLEREARGLRPVNALWLDGCARGPLPPARGTVVTDDPALAGLAGAAGARVIDPSPASMNAASLAAHASQGDVLVDVGLWRTPRRVSDGIGWLEAWRAFDRWLAGAGLGRGAPAGFDAMRAVFGAERRLVELGTTRSARWQPWRRFDAPAAVLTP